MLVYCKSKDWVVFEVQLRKTLYPNIFIIKCCYLLQRFFDTIHFTGLIFEIHLNTVYQTIFTTLIK